MKYASAYDKIIDLIEDSNVYELKSHFFDDRNFGNFSVHFYAGSKIFIVVNDRGDLSLTDEKKMDYRHMCFLDELDSEADLFSNLHEAVENLK
jgi:hypothetical protein